MPCVERVEAVQRERLGATRSGVRRRVGAVVGQDAVREREAAGVVEAGAPRALLEHPQPDLDVAEQPALVGEADLGAERELARAAEVVDDRGGEQQVLVQPRVQRARLHRERRDGDGVLEQPAEVGVVARRACTASGAARRAARRRRARRRPGAGTARRGPRRRGARGSRRARRGRGRRRAGTRRGRPRRRARVAIARTSTCSSSRKRSTRPATRTRSPRSKRAACEVGVAEDAARERARAVAQLDARGTASRPARAGGPCACRRRRRRPRRRRAAC